MKTEKKRDSLYVTCFIISSYIMEQATWCNIVFSQITVIL